LERSNLHPPTSRKGTDIDLTQSQNLKNPSPSRIVAIKFSKAQKRPTPKDLYLTPAGPMQTKSLVEENVEQTLETKLKLTKRL